MTDGFIKTAAGTIDVQVADVQTNTDTTSRACGRRTRPASTC